MARKTTHNTNTIVAFMDRNPDAKPAQVAKALKVPVVRVYAVRAKLKQMGEKQDALSTAQVNAVYQRAAKLRAEIAPVKKGFWATVVGWFR